MWVIAAVSVYSAYESGQAQNRAADRATDNANRRYAIQSGVAENQMEEQQMMALEKMTDVTRGFLVAKGRDKVIQAETGVTGNVQKRLKAMSRTKESEVKGTVAKEIDTNVINIAQGMIANKIDTEALISEAQASKKSSMMIAADMVAAGASGYMTGSSLKKSFSGTGTGTGVKNTGYSSGK